MKKLQKRLLMAMVVLALVAFAVPVIGLRAGAASRSTEARPKVGAEGLVGPQAPAASATAGQEAAVQTEGAGESRGKVARSVYDAMGIPRVPAKRHASDYSMEIANSVTAGLKAGGSARSGGITPESGEPVNMSACAAFSAAIIT